MGDDGRIYVPEGAVAVYRDEIVPLASVLTPNQYEAELLTGMKISSEADALAACQTLHARGPRTVVWAPYARTGIVAHQPPACSKLAARRARLPCGPNLPATWPSNVV